MSFIIYKNTVTELRKEIEQSNINKLEQVVDMTNNRLEELENIAAMISFDLRLTPYMMEDDYYRKQAIQELKKYRSNSSIIEDIFVYYPDVDNELLYSSSGIYSLGTLINQKYQFKDLTKVNLKSHLQTTVPKVISKSYYGDKKKTRNNMIILFYPISLNNPHPYGTVMYFINESMLTNLTHNMLGNIQGDTFIFDGNNQIITMTERDYNIDRKSTRLNSSPTRRSSDLYYGDKKKTRNNMIILFYPISLNNPHPYGTVMYFINESMLTNLTHNMLGNIQGDTFIFDGNNQIITMTERDYN